ATSSRWSRRAPSSSPSATPIASSHSTASSSRSRRRASATTSLASTIAWISSPSTAGTASPTYCASARTRGSIGGWVNPVSHGRITVYYHLHYRPPQTSSLEPL